MQSLLLTSLLQYKHIGVFHFFTIFEFQNAWGPYTIFTRFVARALIFFNLTHCWAPIQTGVYLSTGTCYFQSKITTKIIVEDKYFTTFNLSPYDLIIT